MSIVLHGGGSSAKRTHGADATSVKASLARSEAAKRKSEESPMSLAKARAKNGTVTSR